MMRTVSKSSRNFIRLKRFLSFIFNLGSMRKPSAYDLFYDPWNFSLLKIVEIKEEPLIIKNHTKQLKISEKEKNRTQIFLD